MVDLIGCRRRLEVSGHINLLSLLPHRSALLKAVIKKYGSRPGNYAAQYDDDEDGPTVQTWDLGHGFLSIKFTDSITQPEMSQFLLQKGWKLLNAQSTVNKGDTVVYEKWTTH